MTQAPETFTLETERLIIRPFAPDDLDTLHAIMNEGFGEEPLDQRREWLEWSIRNYTALSRLYQPPYGDRAIALKTSGDVVGIAGLVPTLGPYDTLPYFRERLSAPPTGLFTTEMGLFWAVRTAHRGCGYATEAARTLITFAFETLGMQRIVATADDENTRSSAVMRRLGMRVEHNPHATPDWFQVVGILENPAARAQPE